VERGGTGKMRGGGRPEEREEVERGRGKRSGGERVGEGEDR